MNSTTFWYDVHLRLKAFWLFNCTMYRPVSVAYREWLAYMVKVEENWWCPFAHETKKNYAVASIDYSCWHASEQAKQLHPDDQDNPIWNKEAEPSIDSP